jgi:hypothetical protein
MVADRDFVQVVHAHGGQNEFAVQMLNHCIAGNCQFRDHLQQAEFVVLGKQLERFVERIAQSMKWLEAREVLQSLVGEHEEYRKKPYR